MCHVFVPASGGLQLYLHQVKIVILLEEKVERPHWTHQGRWVPEQGKRISPKTAQEGRDRYKENSPGGRRLIEHNTEDQESWEMAPVTCAVNFNSSPLRVTTDFSGKVFSQHSRDGKVIGLDIHQGEESSSCSKEERGVGTMGDSLLRGIESAICRPYMTSREVSCLKQRSRTWWRDLANQTHWQLFLSSLSCWNRRCCQEECGKTVERDQKQLSRKAGKIGAQVSYLSILIPTGRTASGKRWTAPHKDWEEWMTSS